MPFFGFLPFSGGFAHDVRRKANPESGFFVCVCESTEQRRLAQSKGLRKLPDGENGACWTYREGTGKFQNGEGG